VRIATATKRNPHEDESLDKHPSVDHLSSYRSTLIK